MEAHTKPPDIFLSHNGKQKGFVKDLAKKLSSIGYSVFFDQNDDSLPPGQRFPDLILAAAKTCKLGVVVLSDEFLCSRWPMIELCAFGERLSRPSDASSHGDSFTLLPLFYELSPEDMKRKGTDLEENQMDGWHKLNVWTNFWRNGKEQSKMDRWLKEWEKLEREYGHHGLTVANCEAVVKILASRKGIVRLDRAVQGEASYRKEVVSKIKGILPCSSRVKLTDPCQKYSGRDRHCNIIFDEFRKLEPEHPSPSDLHAYVLGMYGVPGSGKSTLCTFLCDHDAVFDEFGQNVIYLHLPSDIDLPHVASDYVVLIQRYSKLITRHRDVASMDPVKVGKTFLVMDNILPSNRECYRRLLQAILSSTILRLAPGSKVLLVAQADGILEDFMLDVQGHSTYRNAITEVPCFCEEEAMEIIRNTCDQCLEDDLIALPYIIRKMPPSLYIPFVFKQIGSLLRVRYSTNARNANPKVSMEVLFKIVSESTNVAVHNLVDINFKQLTDELQVLFYDIALFIIPAGYSKLDEAALILNRMNRTTDAEVYITKMKIHELRSLCFLAITEEEELVIHDIFMVYAAESVTRNSVARLYANETLSRVLSVAPSSARVDLKRVEARTVNIGVGPMDVVSPVRDIDLYIEIGAKSKALIFRNISGNSAKFTLVLSGDLSSLVWMEVENVQHVVILPSAAGRMNLLNLVRLELRNKIKKYPDIPTMSDHTTKRMCSFFDFITHPIIQNCKGMSLTWISKSVLPWEHCSLTSYNDVMRSIAASGMMMMSLQELILVNAGVRRLEDMGRYCPQLRHLEVRDEQHQLMSVSIGSSTPKLKRLIIEFCEYRRAKCRPKKSSKLVLQLGECRELEEVWVDVCSFDRVELVGLRPSTLQRFGLVYHRGVYIMGMTFTLLSRNGLPSSLRVLMLHNPGIPRLDLEGMGPYCSQLEVLEIRDDNQKLMSVTIGSNTKNLKILVIEGRFYKRRKKRPTYTRSSKLVLKLGECRELMTVSLDVCNFGRLDIEGPLSSSRLYHFRLAHISSGAEVMRLISLSRLTQLSTLEIHCNKLQTLNFKKQLLPLLYELVVCDCNSLRHISIHPSCLPNLRSLLVRHCNSLAHISIHPSYLPDLRTLSITDCKKLQVLEGLEGQVKEQLEEIYLVCLPHLQSELRFGGVQLSTITVIGCNSLTHISIHRSCVPNLRTLLVKYCEELQVLEGLESQVKEQLEEISLVCLPHLQCELRFGGVLLKEMEVRDCPGVKVCYDMLVSSKSMEWIALESVCIVSVPHPQKHGVMDEMDDDDMRMEVPQQRTTTNMDAFVELGYTPQQHVSIAPTTATTTSQKEEYRSGMFLCSDHHRGGERTTTTTAAASSSMSLLTFHNRLTLRDGQLTLLYGLVLDGGHQLEHLQEIDGLQHLLVLRCLDLSNLPSLRRVSGTWPQSISWLKFKNCSMLQEVPRFEHTPELRWVSFEECQNMESFPMEDTIHELGQMFDKYHDHPFSIENRPHLNVCGSKFATVELMQRWLREAHWESYISVAAVECLSWKYVTKGAMDALAALVEYFLGLSSEVIQNCASRHHEIIFHTTFSYRKEEQDALPSAFKQRLSELQCIADSFGIRLEVQRPQKYINIRHLCEFWHHLYRYRLNLV